MMKKEMKKVPAVRFTGFTGDWEQRKVSDIAGRYDNLRVPVSSNKRVHGTTPYYGANGVQDYVDGYTHDGEYILIAEDGANDLQNYPVHYVNGRIWVNNHAHVLQGKTGIADTKFLSYAFSQIDISSLLVGGGRAKLNAGVLMKLDLLLPEHKEQEKLGNYFSHIDSLITLHQRKSDQLKKLKAYFLQNLFPAKGEKVPKIRFKGFTDDWEQRKLGDGMYIKSRIGWQKLTKNEYLANGEYYLITGTDINENNHTVDLSKSYFVSKERYDKDKNIQVHDGDIIVTKDGTIGKVAMVCNLDKPATLNSHLFVLRDLSGKLDNRFLLQILSSPLFKRFIDETKTGSTLTGLPQKTFINFQFMMPLLKEQKKIASTLDRLDALITLHQRKLEALQTLKKFLLQNLFV
jgi:type I restriction enzyme, S subunit